MALPGPEQSTRWYQALLPVAERGGPLLTLALDACQKLADIAARRHTSAIEASPHGETLAVNSLYGALAMTTGHKRDTTTHADALTVYQSNGTTELAQVPLQTDPDAVPIVEVGG